MSIWGFETTRDAFLGERIWLEQPRTGYRAGIDPVLLAASVPARPGQSVLDLGCGVGTALYCLGSRVSGLTLAGLERHAAAAELARANATSNGFDAQIVCGDIAAMPSELKARRFDHVLTNPPYYDRSRGSSSPDAAREAALGETLPLIDWIAAGARRLEPRGRLSAIQKAERLPDLLSAMQTYLGSLAILPIQPRSQRQANLVIVQGIKGGRARTRIAAPFILHEGPPGSGNARSFSAAARSVLRDAAPLISFPRCSEQ